VFDVEFGILNLVLLTSTVLETRLREMKDLVQGPEPGWERQMRCLGCKIWGSTCSQVCASAELTLDGEGLLKICTPGTSLLYPTLHPAKIPQLKKNGRDTWVALSVKHQTLDFSSGHDLRVLGSSPASGSMLSGESVWDFLSPSPSAPPPLKINKNKS